MVGKVRARELGLEKKGGFSSFRQGLDLREFCGLGRREEQGQVPLATLSALVHPPSTTY
jgi:hypothetical protein